MFFVRFAQLLIRQRLLFVLITVLLSGFMVVKALSVKADFTITELFAQNDPDRVHLEAFRKQYGADDDLAVIMVQAEDVFSKPSLRLIKTLTQKLSKLRVVRRVDSLTNISDLGAPGSGAIDTRALFFQIPERQAALAALKKRALGSPLIVKRMVSKDGTLAVIATRLAKGYERAQKMAEAVEAIEKTVKAEPLPKGVNIAFAGIPVVRTHVVRMLYEDQMVFIPLGASMTALVLFLLYRRIIEVVLPLLATGLSLAYALGLMALMGRPLDILSNVLPVLVMVYGIADAIHMINRYHEEHRESGKRELAISMMVRHLGMACLLTSGTTAIGFSSLAIADMDILVRFGLLAALGVSVAYVVAMVVVPLTLFFFARSRRAAEKRHARLEALLGRIASFVTARPLAVLLGSLLFGGIAIGLGSTTKVDNFVLGTVGADHPISVATRLAGSKLQGVVTMQITVEGKPGTLKRPEVLHALASLQDWLHEQDGVTGSLSPVDFLEELYRAVAGETKLARDKKAIAQLYLMAEGVRGLDRVLGFDYRRGRIEVTLRDIGAKRYLPLAEKTQKKVSQLFSGIDGGVSARVTGTSALAYRAVNAIVFSLLKSLGLALLLIGAILALAFRSLKVGLISLIPNAIPLAVGLGFMGLVGMYLEPTTVMVYSVAFGIAVDDTIHFVARYREELQNGHESKLAIARTLKSAGSAMVITSLVLMVGFAVVLASNFPATRRFGIAGLVILGAAILTDLFVTPACMQLFCRNCAAPQTTKPNGD
jgi:predicted RND superfamily exporter protein